MGWVAFFGVYRVPRRQRFGRASSRLLVLTGDKQPKDEVGLSLSDFSPSSLRDPAGLHQSVFHLLPLMCPASIDRRKAYIVPVSVRSLGTAWVHWVGESVAVAERLMT